MKFSGLSFAVILLSSSVILAQHSSGGGGGSGGSSSSGGGGSHSSSSSGSSFAGGSSHNSSVSSSHSSSAHAASGHVSGGLTPRVKSPAQGANGVQKNPVRLSGILQSKTGQAWQEKRAAPEKRGFLSFLRHPFHRSQPKAVADLRRPVCFRGQCAVCPAGQASAGVGCSSIPRFNRNRDICTNSDVWSGGACVQQIHFLNDCNALRTAVQRQEQRLEAIRLAQQTACAQGSIQECSDSMNASRGEESLYRSLQLRYQRCQQQLVTNNPFGTNFLSADHAEPLFDHLNFDAEY